MVWGIFIRFPLNFIPYTTYRMALCDIHIRAKAGSPGSRDDSPEDEGHQAEKT